MPSSFFKLFQVESAVVELTGPPSMRPEAPETIGLLSTPELETVLAECRSHVARIAKQCRARNLRYRDVDFDVENDQDRCLNGLVVTDVFTPSDVQRVSELFEDPQFFVDGPHRNEIIQGQKCSNCWFISALAATSTVKGLVEKYCVASEFMALFSGATRDGLLFTSVPKYEELSIAEKALFQNDKDRYNASARKGSKTLYFAKSGRAAGETWAPLVEKAYAKLHGDYGSLCSGYASEGVEDLTGGVSSFIQCKDILDKDKFWKEELLHANRDRVFSCSFQGLNPTRNGNFNATVNVSGKRFLVLRNPCGQAEWNGPFSDGSKEWTPELMNALPQMEHKFGAAGQFIMEYKDFLTCFEQVDRTRLFDSSWTMRYNVVRVPPRPFPGSGFGYGDLCFSFSISKTAFTIIVLSQLDGRYFKGISQPCYWNFDFVLFKRGQKEPLDASSHSRFTARSVGLEFPELEEGQYIVHVSPCVISDLNCGSLILLLKCRLDKVPFSDKNADQWSQSKLARVISERATSESVATNFKADFHEKNLPIPLDILAGQDISDLSRKAIQLKVNKKRNSTASDHDSRKDEDESMSKADTKVADEPNTTTTITTITTVRGPSKITTDTKEVVLFGSQPPNKPVPDDDDDDDTVPCDSTSAENSRPSSPPLPNRSANNGAPFLGLKVYTPKDVAVSVQGELRHEMRSAFEGLTVADWKSFAL
ncbi:Calpain catalytic domain-containing protein [Mycena venus]|uniref:Calpain catalytic domain-containing protein n=1 Tax=Mycena venus TaxID=2733690 RepID=A0A8H6X508_9AGAR|nr:Calpain catalytic domain-containing protein [Mycena venus]